MWRFTPSDNTIVAGASGARDRSRRQDRYRAVHPARADAGITCRPSGRRRSGSISPSTPEAARSETFGCGAHCAQVSTSGKSMPRSCTASARSASDLQPPWSSWYDRSLQPCPHDPAQARRLLDQAGWHVGPDGIRIKDGKPLQITFTTVAGIIDREQTAAILQSRWREIGVDTLIKTFPCSDVLRARSIRRNLLRRQVRHRTVRVHAPLARSGAHQLRYLGDDPAGGPKHRLLAECAGRCPRGTGRPHLR